MFVFYEGKLGFAGRSGELLEDYPEGIDVEHTSINDELEYGFVWRISASEASEHSGLPARRHPGVPAGLPGAGAWTASG